MSDDVIRIGRGYTKATNEQLRVSYARTQSCRETAQEFGMCAQSVHERLVRMKINTPLNVFTEAEFEYLRTHYDAYAMAGKLADLAKLMNRTKPFICRQAGELGLTDQSRTRSYIAVWKYMPLDAAEILWENFKKSKYGLNQYCKKKSIDPLGFSRRMKEFFAAEWDHVIELKAPKSSKYVLGRAFEYRTRDLLKEHGFFVMRSPGSRSPVDLIAYAHGRCLMIQCKRNGSLAPVEWNIFFDLAVSVGAKPIMAAIPKKTQHGVALFELISRKSARVYHQPLVHFSLTPPVRLKWWMRV